MTGGSGGGFEQLVDELDLTYDARLFVMDVGTFYCSDCFNPA